MFHNGRFYKRIFANSVAEEITFEDMGYKNVIGNQVLVVSLEICSLDVGGSMRHFLLGKTMICGFV